MEKRNFDTLKTPSYVIDEQKLINNLTILEDVAKQSGCKILLAQKAFSAFALYPLIGQYLAGTTASGLYEAKLGYEEMGKENHIFSPAYTQEEFSEILEICDHVIFNSFTQWKQFKAEALAKGKSCGMRINPQHSTQDHAIYDPCAVGSRLGVILSQFENQDLSGLDGLHFHTLCQQNADALLETLEVVERNFGKYLYGMKWLNLGGGHHITRKDYDRTALIQTIKRLKETYELEIYLEPGEAVALDAGYLVTTVLDIVENGMQIAILDTSPSCHMPDVIEMPYRPPLFESGMWDEKDFSYRLSSATCLSGDVIGDYSFDKPLYIGDKLIFEDMAIYSMVKNNTFNGMALPSISLLKTNQTIELIKEFSYIDFKNRLS